MIVGNNIMFEETEQRQRIFNIDETTEFNLSSKITVKV